MYVPAVSYTMGGNRRRIRTMGEERLAGLALLHVHHDMSINVEQIVTRFAQLHPRRLSLENIFS